MKKAFVVLLLIVIAVLVFLLIRSRRNVGMIITNQPYKNTTIKVQQCPAAFSIKGQKFCVLPVEYLQQMGQPGGDPDDAIVVHHKDTLVWISLNGQSFNVSSLQPINCVNQQGIPVPTGADPYLTDTPQGDGSLKYAHVTANGNNDNNCYKTDISFTTPGKKAVALDPHLFDGGP